MELDDKYIENHEDITRDGIIGVIQKDSIGNYYCGDYALNKR